MNKKAAVLLLTLALIGLSVPSRADRYNRATGDNPARLVAYALHPLGLAVEFVVMRPVHWVVSQPHLDIVFGHESAVEQDGTYFEWKHGNFKPSIAAEKCVPAAEKPAAPAAKAPAAAPAVPKAEGKKGEAAPKGADKTEKAGSCGGCGTKK